MTERKRKIKVVFGGNCLETKITALITLNFIDGCYRSVAPVTTANSDAVGPVHH